MLLIVLLFVSNVMHSSHDREPMSVTAMSASVVNMAARSSSVSEDELCDAALEAFIRRTDYDISRYVKPHLVSVIKEAVSSPDSDSDNNSPSPKRVIRTWVRQPESVRTTPRQELDEVVLAAVQKAFEEKEAELDHKAKKIERMFSKKTTTAITTVVGVIVAIVSSLGSVYGTKNDCNCTK
jgi:hypothetical protein